MICSDAEPMTLEAAAGEDGKPRVRRFSMTAYTGGAMSVAGYYWPVIADLAGMTVATQRRPILKQHDPDQIVGHTEKIDLTSQTIKLSGSISGVGDAAQEVTATADNGFPWQGSIGAAVQQLEFVDRGNTVKVNGKNFIGPVYVARKTTLKEVSFVPLGGDDNTSATIAAEHTRGNAMGFEAWLKAQGWDAEQLTDGQRTTLKAAYDAEIKASNPPADPPANPPVPAPAPIKAASETVDPNKAIEDLRAEMRREQAAETTRINAIRRLCAAHDGLQITVDGKKVDLEAHAIEAGLTAEATELHILRAARPKSPAIHMSDNERPAEGVLEAALAIQGKLGDDRLVAAYGEQTLDAARKHYRNGVSLKTMLLEAAWENGYTDRHFPRGAGLRQLLRAAFSSYSLPGHFSNTANKFMLAGFESVESTWREISATRDVNDFKQVTSYRLTGALEFEPLTPAGTLAHGTIDEESFTNQARTYGIMIGITREDIKNDDLGALTQVPRRIGRGGALKLNTVFWTAFMNNSDFFKSANNNYQEGAGTALSVDSLTTLEQLFLDQVDPDGKPLALTPAILLVPNALNVTASQISRDLEIRDTTASKVRTTSNPHAGKFRPVRSSYLSNSAITGNSTKAHYLLADPMDLAVIETCFVDGVQQPFVETADADFDSLGVQMRGYLDFGVNKQEHRAGAKSKGEA